MKKFWGERAGLMLHIVGYTLVPILVGISLLLGGLQGA